MVAFNRYGLSRGHTWAYELFKRHHEELNALYWSYSTVVRDAKRQGEKVDEKQVISKAFSLSRSNQWAEFRKVSLWKDKFSDFDNWTRLNAALALFSYFEVYLHTVVCLALESDPGVQLGATRAIDGVKILKSERLHDSLQVAEECVKGDWTKRVNKYKSLFGQVPSQLVDEISELDQLRNLRNGVGHTFGRELTAYKSRIALHPAKMSRLSEDRLKKWLGLIHEIALSIDKHLGFEHIGEYETIYYYHQWLPTNREPWQREGKAKSLRIDGAFSIELNRILTNGPGAEFCKDLVSYYDSI